MFDEARTHLKAGGKFHNFPGAVGVISLIKNHYHSKMIAHGEPFLGKPNWLLPSMHGFFHLEKSKLLTRNITSKYGGWRERLLGEIFRQASQAGASLSLEVSITKNHPMSPRAKENQLEVFRKIAAKSGFLVKEKGNFLVAYKK